mgnify:CR=1 FL=1
MRCGTCGFEGAGEEVVAGMQVCPSCGALAAEGIDAVFDRTVFRRARRLVGRLPDRVSPGLFDAADRPLARGMRTTRGARMALAWIAGAVTLTVGGAITLAAGVDDVNTIENAADGSAWASVEDAYARGPVLTGIGAAILGLGVASLGVSAALLAHFGADGTWIEARIGPGSLMLRGVF